MATTAAMQKRGPYAVDLRVLAELEKNKLAMRAHAVGGGGGGGGGGGEKAKRATSAHQPSSKQVKAVKRRPVSATTAELGLRAGAEGGTRGGNIGNVVLNGIGMRERNGTAPSRPRAASGTKRNSSMRKKENAPTSRTAGRGGASAPSSAALGGSSSSVAGRGGGRAAAGALDSKHNTELGTLRSIYTQSHTKPSSVVAATAGRPRPSQPAWGAAPPTTLAPVSVPTASKELPRSTSASTAPRAIASNRSAADAAAAPPPVGRPAPSPSPSPDAEVLVESSRARATMPELVAKYRNAPSMGDLEGFAWETGAVQKAFAPTSGSGTGGRARPASAGRLRAPPAAAAVAAAEADTGCLRSSAEMVREWKRSCAGAGDGWGIGKSGDAGGVGSCCPGSPGLRGSLDDGVIGLGGSNPQTPEGVVKRWKEESKERMRSGKTGEPEATARNIDAGGAKDAFAPKSALIDTNGAPSCETLSRVRKKLLGSMEGAATVAGGGAAGSEVRKSYTERIRGLAGATPLAVKEDVMDAANQATTGTKEHKVLDLHDGKGGFQQHDLPGESGVAQGDEANKNLTEGAGQDCFASAQPDAANNEVQPERTVVEQQASAPSPGVKLSQKLPSPPPRTHKGDSGFFYNPEMERLMDDEVWNAVDRFFSFSDPLPFGFQ